NARDSDQIRPLLPAGPGCVVVVTSRRQLIGLAAAEGAHLIMLDLFDPADARQMLITRLGRPRVAAEPEAASELIELCAGLPLALSLAAGRLGTRSDFPIETLVAQLRDIRQQLDVLSPGDAAGDLRTLFACTYRQLSPAAARMFRLLGLHPGPDVSLPAAASLAGLEPAETRRALTELTGTHLATELTPDRWGLHDLLRAYAAELAAADDSPADRAAALDRLATHYLATMHAVDRLRYPQYRPVAFHSWMPGVTVVPCTDAEDGLAWCQAERPALTALLIHAADTDPDGYPGSLLAAVWLYFHLWSHHHDVAAARRVAQTAAGPESGAVPAACTGNDPARDGYREVLERGLRRGDALARVYTLFGMAQLLARVGRPAPALTFAALARDRCRDLDDRAGAAFALSLTGRVQLALGHPDQATDSGTQALDLCRDLGDQAGEAFAADTLGLATMSVGDHAGAIAHGLQAAELFDRLAETDAEVDALVHLGHAYRAAGNEAAAARVWHIALTRLEDPLHPQAVLLRQLTMSAND
ncbi:MAG TPA: tetratricopeptide repeat protein, partial [Actinoplanes sp.]